MLRGCLLVIFTLFIFFMISYLGIQNSLKHRQMTAHSFDNKVISFPHKERKTKNKVDALREFLYCKNESRAHSYDEDNFREALELNFEGHPVMNLLNGFSQDTSDWYYSFMKATNLKGSLQKAQIYDIFYNPWELKFYTPEAESVHKYRTDSVYVNDNKNRITDSRKARQILLRNSEYFFRSVYENTQILSIRCLRLNFNLENICSMENIYAEDLLCLQKALNVSLFIASTHLKSVDNIEETMFFYFLSPSMKNPTVTSMSDDLPRLANRFVHHMYANNTYLKLVRANNHFTSYIDHIKISKQSEMLQSNLFITYINFLYEKIVLGLIKNVASYNLDLSPIVPSLKEQVQFSQLETFINARFDLKEAVNDSSSIQKMFNSMRSTIKYNQVTNQRKERYFEDFKNELKKQLPVSFKKFAIIDKFFQKYACRPLPKVEGLMEIFNGVTLLFHNKNNENMRLINDILVKIYNHVIKDPTDKIYEDEENPSQPEDIILKDIFQLFTLKDYESEDISQYDIPICLLSKAYLCHSNYTSEFIKLDFPLPFHDLIDFIFNIHTSCNITLSEIQRVLHTLHKCPGTQTICNES